MTIKEISIIAVCALLLGIGSCVMLKHDKKIDTSIKATVLPIQDKEKISITQEGKVQIVTAKGVQTVSGSRGTVIDIQKDGTVKVTEKTYGFEHQVGFNGFISEKMGLGLDLRYFYFKRFDAMAGIGYMPQTKNLTGWLGLGYTPSTSWMSNTTFFAGYSVAKYPVAGISLRF